MTTFVEVPKRPGTWEANTMATPAQILAAMDRHSDKAIIFVDIDRRVLGDLSPLAGITGDVGFYIRPFRRAGRVRFAIRSRTMVIRPNQQAHRFVSQWAQVAAGAPWGSADQDALMVAMGRVARRRPHDAGGRVVRHDRR